MKPVLCVHRSQDDALISANVSILDWSVEYDTKDDGEVVLKIAAEGTVITLAAKNDSFSFVVTENNKQVASGSLTATEVIEGDDVTVTVEADLCDNQNDLLDYKTVSVNGVLTLVDVSINGYFVNFDEVWDPVLEEWTYVETESFITLLTFAYNAEDGEDETVEISLMGLAFTFMQKDGLLRWRHDAGG